jgi:hypothetical protein
MLSMQCECVAWTSIARNSTSAPRPARAWEGRYHLRFNAATESTFDRCIQDLVRFVDEHGLPWFNQFEDVECLLTRADSPVQAEARSLLIDAIHGRATSDHFAASLKLLGIKNAQT